jgi:hypothetical protein
MMIITWFTKSEQWARNIKSRFHLRFETVISLKLRWNLQKNYADCYVVFLFTEYLFVLQ